jgi:Flp pilus assembly pilin Flp
MKAAISRFARDERGATAIEYTVIAVLMAAALVALWPAFYSDFTQSWVERGESIKNASQ